MADETDYAALAGALTAHLENIAANMGALYDLYPMDLFALPSGARHLLKDMREEAQRGRNLYPRTILSATIIPIADDTKGRKNAD